MSLISSASFVAHQLTLNSKYKGEFREDLYFELSVAELTLPPLRNRQEDIPQLVSWYCGQLNEQFQSDRHLSSEAITCLQSYHWPGNIKEFEMMLKRLFVSANGRQISEAAVEKELQKSISVKTRPQRDPGTIRKLIRCG